MGLNSLSVPVKVEVYSDLEAFSKVSKVPVIALNQSGTVAICQKDRILLSSPMLYAKGYHFLLTVTHELVHYLVIKKSNNQCPLWLHEGLAKYYEDTWQDNKLGKISVAEQSILAEALSKDALVPIKKMSPSFAYLKDGENVTAFAQVFTMVKLILKKPGAMEKLLGLLATEIPFDKAFLTAYGKRFSSFLKVWKRWLRRQKFRVLEEVPDLIPRHLSQVEQPVFKAVEEDELKLVKRVETEEKEGNNSKKGEINKKSKNIINEGNKFKLIGNLLFDHGRFLASKMEFEKAYQKMPSNLSVLKKLGFLYVKHKEYRKASKVLKEGNNLFGKVYFFPYWMGRLALKQKKYKEAGRFLYQAFLANAFDRETLSFLIKADQLAGNQRRVNILKRHQKRLTGEI